MVMKANDHFTEVHKNQTCDFAINISVNYVRMSTRWRGISWMFTHSVTNLGQFA